MDVENLVPGQEYKFRVMAVNAEGDSEPLDADHAIIAKNPFGQYIFAKLFGVFHLCHKLLTGCCQCFTIYHFPRTFLETTKMSTSTMCLIN